MHYQTVLCFLTLLCFAFPIHASEEEPPALLLANVYHDDIDLEDFWVSEKYDGVRAYWDGRRLISRGGRVFSAPAWFTEGFPEAPLDGELWMGRGTFEELSGAVRRQTPDDSQWLRIRFMVFDMPEDENAFDQRLKRLQSVLANGESPFAVAVEQFKVPTREALIARLEEIVKAGGEGLMLHRGDSLYRGGRSDDLLKLKPYGDAEATVIGHLPGKGKYQGMLGALWVESPDQLRFRIGTGFTDAQRRSPPPVGSVVTYKYFGKTKNELPRFASFLRVRAEL